MFLTLILSPTLAQPIFKLMNGHLFCHQPTALLHFRLTKPPGQWAHQHRCIAQSTHRNCSFSIPAAPHMPDEAGTHRPMVWGDWAMRQGLVGQWCGVTRDEAGTHRSMVWSDWAGDSVTSRLLGQCSFQFFSAISNVFCFSNQDNLPNPNFSYSAYQLLCSSSTSALQQLQRPFPSQVPLLLLAATTTFLVPAPSPTTCPPPLLLQPLRSHCQRILL